MILIENCSNINSHQAFETYKEVIDEFKPTPVQYHGDWLSIVENYYNQGGLFLIAVDVKHRKFRKDIIKIIGTMGIRRYGNVALLKHVAVLKDYRGKMFDICLNYGQMSMEDNENRTPDKIANKMLWALERFCKEKCLKSIVVGTDSYYPSGLKFYKKHGYTSLNSKDISKNTNIFKMCEDYKDVDDTWLIKELTVEHYAGRFVKEGCKVE